MSTKLKARIKAAPVVIEEKPPIIDTLDVEAREFAELDVWRKSPEVAPKLARHEALRKILQLAWKEQNRNAPWMHGSHAVFFVQQTGKAYPVCGTGCLVAGKRREPEWHVKVQQMVSPSVA